MKSVSAPRYLMALVATALCLLARPISAQLIWPGEKIATIDAEHIRAFVPYAHREELKQLVARADQIYGKMKQDAGFTARRKLYVLFGDWVDAHNGFSFVVPFPLVQIELAPAMPESSIYAGGATELERTLIHEFAHQISNDRSRGFRSVLENIFGRVLPNDLFSGLLWYFSTPPHQTQPRFWQEGLATWAETEYADPKSPWAGRGRDPLIHMVWRLDAAAGAIPSPGNWRITYHEWPFGSRVYLYGTAYTRYLDAHLGDKLDVWKMIDWQAEQWPWVFNRAPRRGLRQTHGMLIKNVRHELKEEQTSNLEHLRSETITKLPRLTPKDTSVGAPAWQADGSLVYSARNAHGRARLHVLHPDGSIERTESLARALSNVRTTAEGDLVRSEYNWRQISRVELAGNTIGWRMLQPDAVRHGDSHGLLATLVLPGGGRQILTVYPVDFDNGQLGEGRTIPSEGRPWNPTFRPTGETVHDLLWVESDDEGSRLVLAKDSGVGERTVLHQVRGRILHPCWSADGQHIYFCADNTGVPNAYRLTMPEGDEPVVVPVTNTIGGVIACVPSPDGKQLAFVEHDHRGPFISKTALNPSAWPKRIPSLELVWPAPLKTQQEPSPAISLEAHSLPKAAEQDADALQAETYNGWSELRPLFWAPTSFAVPEGGYGIIGAAADPLFTHIATTGIGVGPVENEAVGSLGYTYLGWPVHWGVDAWRSERTFGNEVKDSTYELYDYTETVDTAEIKIGRGLFGLERTWLFFGKVGIGHHDSVQESVDRYAGQTLTSIPVFEGDEVYTELTFGYDDATFYPTSFAREDGIGFTSSFRHSGLGGDLERNLAFANGTYTWSLWPSGGHQIAVAAQGGWSDGDETLQGSFSIGGGLSRGLPRGYFDKAYATGKHIVAGSVAYRVPVYRPFEGYGTTPLRSRQIFLEGFFDSGKVSNNNPGGDGEWFSSVGIEAHVGIEFADQVLQPGVGVAYQIDGDEDVQAYFSFSLIF